jgi:hypothetical protein
MKISGLTWYQWARELFSFENCNECRKGVRGHEPATFMGQWFALCKEEVKS